MVCYRDTVFKFLLTFIAMLFFTQFYQYFSVSSKAMHYLWSELIFLGQNDYQIIVFGSLILSTVIYWSAGILYTFLDLTKRPNFLHKYKIQEESGKNPVGLLSLAKLEINNVL